MPDKSPDLDSAYALETPEDNRKLYADWATTYDSGFAEGMGYQLPRIIAEIFRQIYTGPGPVLDVGAGTGLVADHLGPDWPAPIDALDISPEMLAVAAAKGRYRQTIEADLTAPLTLMPEQYDAILSAGTFTHGHLGPDALDPLLALAKTGATFVLSINAKHYEAHGFAAKLATLRDAISDLTLKELPIYAGNTTDHAQDTAQITVFTKA